MATSFVTTTFSGPVNLDLPNAYDLSFPKPADPTATPVRTASRVITLSGSYTALTGKELGSCQTFFINPAGGNFVTFDTAARMIPFFPGVKTGNIYKTEFVNLGVTMVGVVGCTGSYLLGVTGSVLILGVPAGETGFVNPVYIRWDNVSGSTGSYTIMGSGSGY